MGTKFYARLGDFEDNIIINVLYNGYDVEICACNKAVLSPTSICNVMFKGLSK